MKCLVYSKKKLITKVINILQHYSALITSISIRLFLYYGHFLEDLGQLWQQIHWFAAKNKTHF